MNDLLLGIDIGTSAVKALVCDTAGHVLAQAASPHDLRAPVLGWAEESPDEWWTGTIRAVRACLASPGVSADRIVSVGVCGMVPAIVLLDSNNQPIRPSIQQNDARAGAEIDELKMEIGVERFFAITGSTPSQQSVGPKLLWLQKFEPDNWLKVSKIIGSYDYINYCLSGKINIEQNWALESGLFDLNHRDWSAELLAVCGISQDIFAPVRQASEVIGFISQQAAALTGLKPGTPVVAGSADHVAAALAAGIKNNGDLLVKLGSSGDVLASTDSLVLDNRLFIDYHDIPGKYILNGCMATSGSLLKWYVNQFCQADEAPAAEAGLSLYAWLDRQAEEIPAGSDGVVVLPYFLGEKTPIFDNQARGVFYGLSLFHNRHHLYRAILEAVAFGFKHHLEVLKDRGVPIHRVVAAEGGASSRLWRQILADVLQAPILHLAENPGAALAAAFVAGMGVGVFRSWDEIEKYILLDSITAPDPDNFQRYERAYRLYRELYPTLAGLFSRYSDSAEAYY